MALFSTTEENLSVKWDVPVYEGYEYENCGHILAMTEACEDDLNIVKACYEYDMTEIQGLRKIKSLKEASDIETAKEELNIALETKGKNIFKTIGDAIKKAWGKMVNFFKSIYKYLRTFFNASKDFCKRNSEAINRIKFKDGKKVTIQTYDYNATMIYNAAASVKQVKEAIYDATNEFERVIKAATKNDLFGNKTDKRVEDLKEIKEKTLSEIRKILLGVDAGDDNIRELADIKFKGQNYKDGKTEKSFTESEIKNKFTQLEQADGAINHITEFQKSMDTTFALLLSNVQKYSNTSEDKGFATITTMIRENQATVQRAANYVSIYTNAWVDAIKSLITDYTAACRKAILMSGMKVYSANTTT